MQHKCRYTSSLFLHIVDTCFQVEEYCSLITFPRTVSLLRIRWALVTDFCVAGEPYQVGHVRAHNLCD